MYWRIKQAKIADVSTAERCVVTYMQVDRELS